MAGSIGTEAACRLLPAFSSLPSALQSQLLRHNLPLLARLRQAACLACHLSLPQLVGLVTRQRLPDLGLGYSQLWRGEETALDRLQEVSNL